MPVIYESKFDKKKHYKNRLSKADESYYVQFSQMNEKMLTSPAKIKMNNDSTDNVPNTPDKFNKIAAEAAAMIKAEEIERLPIHKRKSTKDIAGKPKLV